MSKSKKFAVFDKFRDKKCVAVCLLIYIHPQTFYHAITGDDVFLNFDVNTFFVLPIFFSVVYLTIILSFNAINIRI